MAETIVNIHEAKTQLFRLIETAGAGETIVIAKAGVSKVTLTPVPRTDRRIPGRFAGQISVSDWFFDPLPQEKLAAWERSLSEP